MKTSELIGPALDWAVAKCIARVHDNSMLNGTTMHGWWISGLFADPNYWIRTDEYQPSTHWAQGGPIIERERINVLAPIVRRIGAERPIFTVDYYRAMICRDENELAIHGRGPTPLVAAMRCYVANKLGEEVDVPEELL